MPRLSTRRFQGGGSAWQGASGISRVAAASAAKAKDERIGVPPGDPAGWVPGRGLLRYAGSGRTTRQGRRSVRRGLPRGQLAAQPGAGKAPVALDGARGDAQDLRRLLVREPGEETQLHEARLLRVD